MSVPRYLLDTNVLLRFLTGDPAPHAAAARKLFERAAAGEVVLDVSPLIVAEAYYTLHSYYDVERKIAAGKLSLLLQQHGFEVRDAGQTFAALALLLASKIGFADAFLAAGAAQEKSPVASFDRDFDKLCVLRFDPAAHDSGQKT